MKIQKEVITTRSIFLNEIEAVKANRFLYKHEKQFKIRELLTHVPTVYKKGEK